jgi:SAM-dependent methyltransferase
MLVAGDLLHGYPGVFKVARCETCQHAFLNPRPTRECIGQFYPADYGPFRGQGAEVRGPKKEGSGVRSWGWLRQFVLWWIDSRAAPMPRFEISNFKSQISNTEASVTPRALELGCSHGSFLEQLRKRGWECVGIEPAEEVARRATERGFDVRVRSLESVVAADSRSFAASSFDAVVAWMVIEHLHDPLATLRVARDLLKPGGTLSISVPNFGCWERRAFGRYWYALQLPTHLQHFTTASLRRMLEASGFELVESIHQRNVNNLVGSVGLLLRTKFPRWSLGERLIRWTDNPTAIALFLLAPLARILALVRQSGRLTLVARRGEGTLGSNGE